MERESPAHRDLKHRIALMIRDAGFEATVEATPNVDDSGGWRADVLGTAPSGRRVAFEIQLAGITIAEGQERTDRYARDQSMTIWVSTRHTVWISGLPSARLVLRDGTITADRGLSRLNDRTPYLWKPAGEVDFSRVVRACSMAGSPQRQPRIFRSMTSRASPRHSSEVEPGPSWIDQLCRWPRSNSRKHSATVSPSSPWSRSCLQLESLLAARSTGRSSKGSSTLPISPTGSAFFSRSTRTSVTKTHPYHSQVPMQMQIPTLTTKQLAYLAKSSRPAGQIFANSS